MKGEFILNCERGRTLIYLNSARWTLYDNKLSDGHFYGTRNTVTRSTGKGKAVYYHRLEIVSEMH